MVGAAASITVSMLALSVIGGTGGDIQPPAPAFETALADQPGQDHSGPSQPAPGVSPPAPSQPSPALSAPAPTDNASVAISTRPGAAGGASADPSLTASPGPARQFTTTGGELTAECIGQLAYLISWSPAPGYRVDDLQRGPATVAQVAFDSTTEQLAVGVSCASGFPQLVRGDE